MDLLNTIFQSSHSHQRCIISYIIKEAVSVGKSNLILNILPFFVPRNIIPINAPTAHKYGGGGYFDMKVRIEQVGDVPEQFFCSEIYAS